MTDAPKIDTQAPDTSREAVSRHIDNLWEMIPASWARQTENLFAALLAERDLADARAAAAAQAMREAVVARIEAYDENARENFAAFKGLPDLEKCWAGHAEAAGQMVRAVKRLPLPDTTALDRLIAERVREAFAALDECLECMEQLRASGDAGFWEWQPGDAYNKGMALIARGSKESRDG